jgi:hypothetical protein
LPSTAVWDRRIARQTRRYQQWREQYLRRKDEGGRTQRGHRDRPSRPARSPFHSSKAPTPSLVFTREPERRHPDGTFYVVPPAAIHPKFGICYHLTSDMVMHYQLLRTTPRGFGSKHRKVGYHRWLCCISASQIGV